MKIFYTFGFLFLLALSTTVFAQSTNWEDYGLTEEDVSELSEETKQSILNSKTPDQTQEYLEKEIEEKGLEEVQKNLPVPIDLRAFDKNNSLNNSEIVSCFDYYTFGSINVDLHATSRKVISGTTMDFSGNVQNENPYAVVEGTLYVKIFKNTGIEKNPNGPDVVDQFIAVDNLNIPANGSVPVEFSWNVPAYATSGDYQVATFFTSDKKFNLMGLSFTDDIVGNTLDFEVAGEQEDLVSFKKDSVVINGNPYFFAAYPPRIEKGQSANIKLSIVNNIDEAKVTKINWKLYKWDAMSSENLIRTFETNVTLKPNSESDVEVSIMEETEPVYLLVGEITHEDTKSIVNIRYVRDGVDKVRLNYPAVNSYPIKKGEQYTLFTCLHNSGQSDVVENNKVVLEVINSNGKIIESYVYEGPVTGDMMAVKKDIISNVNLDVFSINARLYSDGQLVDESTMEYNCKLIDPDSCSSNSYQSIIYGIITLIVLMGLFYLSRRFLRKKDLLVSIVFILLISSVVAPNITEAKSTTWNKTYSKWFAYFWNYDGQSLDGAATGWTTGLKNPNITIEYKARITNLDTGEYIQDGDRVPVGTKVKLDFIKHKNEDVSWVGTGYSADSPYGEWREDGTRPPAEDTCRSKDFVTNYRYNPDPKYDKTFGVYIPLVVDSPNKWFTGLNGLDCKDYEETEIDGKYKICTVTKSGNINPTFNFGSTKGKFYYRYKDGGTCYGNNVAMREQKISGIQGVQTNNNSDLVKNETFKIEVPSKSISYSFTAYEPAPQNNPPNSPTITGPTEKNIGNSASFSIVATDPDGDNIKYGIDWDNNESVDQWVPSTGLISSGTSRSFTKTWSSLGSKTFKAKTFDAGGLSSGWSSHTINIVEVPVVTHTLSFNSNGGSGSMDTLTLEESENINLPNNEFSRDDYKFKNWSIGQSGSGNNYSDGGSFVMGTSNVVLYAQWEKDGDDVHSGTSGKCDYSVAYGCQYDVTATNKTRNGDVYDWNCNGLNGGSTASCHLDLTDRGVCVDDDCDNDQGSIIDFRFNPFVGDKYDTCPLFLEAENVSSCFITSLNSNEIRTTYSADAENKISEKGNDNYSSGIYSVTCVGIDNKNVTKSGARCISNPDLIEN